MNKKDREALKVVSQRCRDGLKEGELLSADKITDLETVLNALDIFLGTIRATSANSSLPPSADIGRQTKKRPKSTRQSGGQPGHTGATLDFVKHPDKIEVIQMDVPPGYKEVGYESRQVTNIIIKREVTEYRATVYEDGRGHRIVAPFPEGVTNKTQYGTSVKAAVTYASAAQLLPYNRIPEVLSEAGINLSEGTVFNFLEKAYEELEGFERWAMFSLLNADLVHFDETGIRVSGSRQWLHVASDPFVTLFMPHHKRGQEAMDAMGILPLFNGIAVHDFWPPYFKYSCQHSVCLAHIDRELTACNERDNSQWSLRMQEFLQETNKEKQEGKLTAEIIEAKMREYDDILKQADEECPPIPPGKEKKRGRVAQGKSRSLVNRLREYKSEVLRFMTNPDVPFTNNQAERDVRMTKVQQKVSGCFRSMNGARHFCRIRSYISTCKKNGVSAIEGIKALYNGKLPKFIHLEQVPEDFMSISLPNAKPPPQEEETPEDEGSAANGETSGEVTQDSSET